MSLRSPLLALLFAKPLLPFELLFNSGVTVEFLPSSVYFGPARVPKVGQLVIRGKPLIGWCVTLAAPCELADDWNEGRSLSLSCKVNS